MMLKFVLSLLLAAIARPATVDVTGRYFPLIRDGAGWRTVIFVANPAREPASVDVTVLGSRGFAEPWRLALRSSAGAITGQTVSAALAPGASMVIETPGTSTALTSGFAVVAVAKGTPAGGFARLIHSANGIVDEVLTVPLSAELEQRSVAPVFLGAGTTTRLVLVSETRAAVVELFLRDPSGTVVRAEVLDFGEHAQEILTLEERFAGLPGFAGTLEWKATFPAADIYEELTLGALVLTNPGGGSYSAVTPMTLPEDQGRRSRH